MHGGPSVGGSELNKDMDTSAGSIAAVTSQFAWITATDGAQTSSSDTDALTHAVEVEALGRATSAAQPF